MTISKARTITIANQKAVQAKPLPPTILHTPYPIKEKSVAGGFSPSRQSNSVLRHEQPDKLSISMCTILDAGTRRRGFPRHEQSREDTLQHLAAAQKESGNPFEEEQKL